MREYTYDEWKEKKKLCTEGRRAPKREPKPIGCRTPEEEDIYRYNFTRRIYAMWNSGYLEKIGERSYKINLGKRPT